MLARSRINKQNTELSCEYYFYACQAQVNRAAFVV